MFGCVHWSFMLSCCFQWQMDIRLLPRTSKIALLMSVNWFEFNFAWLAWTSNNEHRKFSLKCTICNLSSCSKLKPFTNTFHCWSDFGKGQTTIIITTLEIKPNSNQFTVMSTRKHMVCLLPQAVLISEKTMLHHMNMHFETQALTGTI